MTTLDQAVDQSTPEPGTVTPEPAEAVVIEPTETPTPEPAQEEDKDAKHGLQKRVDTLTRRNYQTKAERDFYKAQLEQLQATTTQDVDSSDPQVVNRQIEQKAQQLSEERMFAQRCNQVYEKGVKDIPDFAKAVEVLNMTGVATPQFLRVVLESEAPEQVLKYLSDNLEEAEEIAALSPVKAGMQLLRLTEKLSAKPKPSAAPAPITPVKAQSSSAPDPDKDFDAWIAWRNKQTRSR